MHTPLPHAYEVQKRSQSGHWHEPHDVVPQEAPSVLRSQPAVSVSVEFVVAQLPDEHVNVETVRVRLPELTQVVA